MRQSTIRVLAFFGDDQEFNVDLPQRANRLAALDNVRLDDRDGIASSLLIDLTARFRSPAGKTHYTTAPSGVSGRASQRLCWIGNAPSRWARARLRRDGRHVDWRLSIHPTCIEELSISARVDCIERLPGSLESAFGNPSEGVGDPYRSGIDLC